MYTLKSSHNKLSSISSAISAVVISHLEKINKKFSKEFLEQHGAIQGMLDNISVIAFPMSERSWHCINYVTYPKEPRFFNATDHTNSKVKLSLLGLNNFDVMAEEIYLVEGIWDLLTMLKAGYKALAVPGVNNFKNEWTSTFQNKKVYIIYDNDAPGKNYATLHARKLSFVAKEVKIIDLPPNITYKKKTFNIKDISDIFNIDAENAKKFLDESIAATEPFALDIQERIHEIITAPGSNANKSLIITTMINEDIEKDGGTVLPYNNNQEMALILEGKKIMIGEKIDIFLGRKYGYIPSDVMWKFVKDRLYNIALQKTNVFIFGYSYYSGENLNVGMKDGGYIEINSQQITIQSQGHNDIYIMSGNNYSDTEISILLSKDTHIPTKDKIDTFDKILDLFQYYEDDGAADAQKFLLKVWFYYTFFKPQIKPALCIVGAPGSGKTLLQKVLKGTLFGFDNGTCNPNSMPEEEYTLTSMLRDYKYLFLDEVNDSDAKLKSKLRMLVTGEETIFRPKYARNPIRFRPDVWLVLSAHSPKFRDVDISQRLSIISLIKPEKKAMINETVFLKQMSEMRVYIWKSILIELQNIIININVNKNQNAPLTNYCRQIEMANFAWQAFPQHHDLCIKTFNNMDKYQTHFSAEFDPLIDIVEMWLETKGQQYQNGSDKIKVTPKQLYNDLLPLIRERNIRSFPVSIAGFGKWLNGRKNILEENFKFEKERNTTTNTYDYYFMSSNKESF